MATKKAVPRKAPAKAAPKPEASQARKRDGLPTDPNHPLYSPFGVDGNK